MVVPDEVPILPPQFSGAPFEPHEAAVHRAGVSHENQADIGRELCKISMQVVIINVWKSKVQLPLHRAGAVMPYQVRPQAGRSAKARRGYRNVRFRVPDLMVLPPFPSRCGAPEQPVQTVRGERLTPQVRMRGAAGARDTRTAGSAGTNPDALP